MDPVFCCDIILDMLDGLSSAELSNPSNVRTLSWACLGGSLFDYLYHKSKDKEERTLYGLRTLGTHRADWVNSLRHDLTEINPKMGEINNRQG